MSSVCIIFNFNELYIQYARKTNLKPKFSLLIMDIRLTSRVFLLDDEYAMENTL